jgi:TM2 domain-containing membrane protein YozV
LNRNLPFARIHCDDVICPEPPNIQQRNIVMPEVCPECGAVMQDELAEKCPLCSTLSPKREKSSKVAALLSLVFPGSGQVYNGEMMKGILVLIGSLVGILIYLVPGIIVWIYGIYEAYTTSEKMNKGKVPFRETVQTNMLLYFAAWIVLAIVVITIVLTVETITLPPPIQP